MNLVKYPDVLTLNKNIVLLINNNLSFVSNAINITDIKSNYILISSYGNGAAMSNFYNVK